MERIFTRQILFCISQIKLKLLFNLVEGDLGLSALLSLLGSDLLNFPRLKPKWVVSGIQEGLNFNGLFFVKSECRDMRLNLKFKFVYDLEKRSLVFSTILMGESVVRDIARRWHCKAVDHWVVHHFLLFHPHL